mmetsp:Transcript_14655/g.62872  ORF Transcript_14655/g.62872 Transcript_14655/m.62872 type:complete len:204 (-) Transcript_14655:1222-1833(-)
MCSLSRCSNSATSTCPEPSASKALTTASSCASESTASEGNRRRTAARNSSGEISPLPSASISANARARSPPFWKTAAEILLTTSCCHSLHPPLSSTSKFPSHFSYSTPSHESSMSAGPTRPPTSRFHARRTCKTCDRPLAQAWKETAPVLFPSHRLKYSSSAALCSMMYSVACVIAAALRISLLLRLDTTGADIVASSRGSHW